jgi:hypothetical protein
MKSAALRQGAGLIVNVKFQTFRVPGAMGCVELLVYGTALWTGRGWSSDAERTPRPAWLPRPAPEAGG